MTRRTAALAAIVLLVGLAGFTAYAQVARPYHDGSVWSIGFIRVKAGMDAAYFNYLASDWKKEQEAMKADGLILSYKVISVEAHTPAEWNLMLMTEYKSLAAMEAGADKADALGQKLFGSDQKMMQGYRERLEIREVLGDRLGRELILEPKR
jgi:hypothetical protein